MKISVVIPAYNAAHFLPRCLESVFAQTLQPAEVIVVDDGSTDGSAETARRLGATVVSRPNGGLSAARNTGIQQASGEWIALLDADDRWSPGKLRAQVECIEPNTVLVYTGIRIFGDDGVRKSCAAARPADVVRSLRYANPITPSSVLAKRDALLKVGGFREDIRACEDWDMWVRLSGLGSFAAVEDSLTDYYVYPSSMSTDPERMLTAMEKILPSTLVSDLSGLRRWAWERRIRAVQLYSAALIARDNGREGEMSYMLRSFAAWPSPFWEPRRFLGAAVTVRNQLLPQARMQ